IRVNLQFAAQSRASRARTIGAVKAECSGGNFPQAYAAIDTGEMLREKQLLPVQDFDQHHARPEFQCCLNRVGQASGIFVLLYLKSINDYLYGMLLILI